jgi:hypothetical protein
LNSQAVNDAPVPTATPVSQAVQYSDAISNVGITATDVDSQSQTATTQFKVNAGSFTAGLPDGLSISGMPACIPGGGGSSCQWTLSGTMNVGAGVYVVRVTASDGTGGQASTDLTITANKEYTATSYTGDEYALTAGPNVTTALVRLAAELTQQADGHPGDITLAKVSFQLFKSGNLGSTPDLTVGGIAVDSSGNASTYFNLPVDIWTVKVRVDSTNIYWKASPIGLGMITVEQATNDLRAGGGGCPILKARMAKAISASMSLARRKG